MKEKTWIMVVGDNPMYLNMIEEATGEYYNVMLATSGEQALRILQRSKVPELILLDIVMPGISGYDTYRHIYDKAELSGIPIIILTGRTEKEAEVAGLKMGAQDYITIPFDRENLLIRICLCVKNGQRKRQLHIFEPLGQSQVGEDQSTILSKELTPTERKVAELIILGCDNRETALRLRYSPAYVKNLVTIVYDKLGVRNRCELWKQFGNCAV